MQGKHGQPARAVAVAGGAAAVPAAAGVQDPSFIELVPLKQPTAGPSRTSTLKLHIIRHPTLQPRVLLLEAHVQLFGGRSVKPLSLPRLRQHLGETHAHIEVFQDMPLLRRLAQTGGPVRKGTTRAPAVTLGALAAAMRSAGCPPSMVDPVAELDKAWQPPPPAAAAPAAPAAAGAAAAAEAGAAAGAAEGPPPGAAAAAAAAGAAAAGAAAVVGGEGGDGEGAQGADEADAEVEALLGGDQLVCTGPEHRVAILSSRVVEGQVCACSSLGGLGGVASPAAAVHTRTISSCMVHLQSCAELGLPSLCASSARQGRLPCVPCAQLPPGGHPSHAQAEFLVAEEVEGRGLCTTWLSLDRLRQQFPDHVQSMLQLYEMQNASQVPVLVGGGYWLGGVEGLLAHTLVPHAVDLGKPHQCTFPTALQSLSRSMRASSVL